MERKFKKKKNTKNSLDPEKRKLSLVGMSSSKTFRWALVFTWKIMFIQTAKHSERQCIRNPSEKRPTESIWRARGWLEGFIFSAAKWMPSAVFSLYTPALPGNEANPKRPSVFPEASKKSLGYIESHGHCWLQWDHKMKLNFLLLSSRL